MGDVYSSALRVLAWLGPGGEFAEGFGEATQTGSCLLLPHDIHAYACPKVNEVHGGVCDVVRHPAWSGLRGSHDFDYIREASYWSRIRII